MRFFQKFFTGQPVVARVAPFIIFLTLTYGQGQFGEASRYWFYAAKTLVGAWLLWEMRPFVKEMRRAFSWEAVVAGMGVFVLWVGLDPFYPKFSSHGATGNPNEVFGSGSLLAWFFIVIHILGMTFIVPPLEEVFYRSFLYRYIGRGDFLSVPMNQFLPKPFIITALVFGFSHNEWLAGILCGAVFQWLLIRKNRLGDAISAHAITNFLLGVWIVCRGAWQFW